MSGRVSATAKIGKNVLIGSDVIIDDNVVIKDNCVVENNVHIMENCYIDFNVIIKENVIIGLKSYIGCNCILGEYSASFMGKFEHSKKKLIIGDNSIIRSGTIIYEENEIGDHFETGHNITVRENSKIGCNVRIGTLSDIQGECEIGNYVRMHSNVHIGQKSKIEDFVWIFPYVVLTNDPTPPSNNLLGVTLKKFSVIATGSILLPGIIVESDTLVAAGALVTKNVNKNEVVGGNPAKVITHISNIKNRFTGEKVYPWRENFKRGMPWEKTDYNTWYANLLL